MSADIKTLRDALAQLLYTPPAAWCGPPLSAALDELEALRGQAAYVQSLDTENQRLRAEKTEAQRDEVARALRRLVKAASDVNADWVHHCDDCRTVTDRSAYMPSPCTCGLDADRAGLNDALLEAQAVLTKAGGQ